MNRALGNKINLVLVLLPAAVLTLFACAGHKLEVQPISKSESPQQLINQLDNSIAMAHKNQVNVLAPTWFKKAESSLNAAKKGLEKGDQLSEILDNIATGRAQLQRAEEITKISRTTLPNAIKARTQARTLAGTVRTFHASASVPTEPKSSSGLLKRGWASRRWGRHRRWWVSALGPGISSASGWTDITNINANLQRGFRITAC